MKFLSLKVLLISSICSGVFAQNLQKKTRPADFEYLSAPDSLGIRHKLVMPNTTNRLNLNTHALPYPIIFIHGLKSNSNIWAPFEDDEDESDNGDLNESGDADSSDLIYNFLTEIGLSYGGRFDFNLNDDNDNTTSNTLIWPTPDADIAEWYTTLIDGDFYFLNFAVGSNGIYDPEDGPMYNEFGTIIADQSPYYNLSNQASIVKQGVALGRTIEQVMNLTNKDKVILFGHSMGGLCAREYLQNSSNWQTDGNHHVAKLITTGTPHGGFAGSDIIANIVGQDIKSEAYRDLKKEYTNNNQGAFLFGGFENAVYIGDEGYYNNDINSNGVNNDNSYIQGLNYKYLDVENVDFAYIIGDCSTCQLGIIEGDGVVRFENANLENFYPELPYPRNKFIYDGNAIIETHTDLPKIIDKNMQGLDEPNEFNLSYEINLNDSYMGFSSSQPMDGYPYDYDYYKFSITENGSYEFKVSNIRPGVLVCNIYDNELNILFNMTAEQYDYDLSNQISFESGQYYIEFISVGSNTSFNYPYNFEINTTLSLDNYFNETEISVYPNPINSIININSKIKFRQAEIYNVLGQKIFVTELDLDQIIDLSELSAGFYHLVLKNSKEIKSLKILKE